MQFEAPVPRTALRWMPALLVVTLLPLLALLPIAARGPLVVAVGLLLTCVLLGAILVGVWLRMRRPLLYRIEGDTLVVPGHLGSVRVRLPSARFRLGPPTGWKVSGTAVPPFRLGAFADREGAYHAAASTDSGVWVRGDRRVFVTPLDVGGFVAALGNAGATPDEGAVGKG
ncbi:MAG: hypothetical protein ACK4YP_27645 [Myxococcota bacterium]